MREYEQRQHPRRLLLKRVLTLLALGFLVLITGAVWDVYKKEQETLEKRAEAEQYLGELQGRERDLRASVARLKTEQGMEEEMRRQFELGKAGEGVIVILDKEVEALPEQAAEPWWHFW